MAILLAVLDLYFAAVLSVSGLAKVENRESFVRLLHGLGLPRRLVVGLARVAPWSEIALAVVLVSGVAALPVAVVVLVVFLGFTAVKAVALAKGGLDCGCYGSARKHTVDGAELATSVSQAILAALLVWAARRNEVSWRLWRGPATAVFLGTSG